MIAKPLYKQLAEAALCSVGEGIPWRSLLAKDHLTVAFMGGSVTQGYANLAIHRGAYPELVANALCERGCSTECVLCAEAGMGTMQGNLIADQYVLARRPDIVFLEFAINETTLKPSVISFESLLRKLLTAPDPPVVCLLMLRSMQGYSCESFMVPIAEHYHLPHISLNKALAPAMERGDLTWQDYGDEESHPNPEGHRLLAEMVLHLLDAAKEAPETAPLPLPEPWLDAPYTGLWFLQPEPHAEGVQTDCEIIPRPYQTYFPTAWKICREGGAFRLTVRCRVLLVFYETHRLPEFGSCRITVDGEPMKQPLIQSNSLYGWGNAKFVTAVSSAEEAEHTLLLEPEEENVYLLGFGICGHEA